MVPVSMLARAKEIKLRVERRRVKSGRIFVSKRSHLSEWLGTPLGFRKKDVGTFFVQSVLYYVLKIALDVWH